MNLCLESIFLLFNKYFKRPSIFVRICKTNEYKNILLKCNKTTDFSFFVMCRYDMEQFLTFYLFYHVINYWYIFTNINFRFKNGFYLYFTWSFSLCRKQFVCKTKADRLWAACNRALFIKHYKTASLQVTYTDY